MAASRDSQGRIVTPPEFASPEFRGHALALQRAGSSIRAIAAETGRSKTALARDVALAREEEAAVRAASRAERAAAVTLPESRPGASVLVLDGAGRLTRADGSVVASKCFTLPRRRYTEGQLGVLESNEHARLERAANVRAGLSPDGFASYETPIGRCSYEPADPRDVARVRSIVRSDWYRYRLAEGDSEEVAQVFADEQADVWQPHPGLR